ncbi:VOC family protein [Paenibacillaceae bacterium WGS1546]|uniref:VOC family protein n=1 Tax=Cohnella sp. WGS1546 TaxID=3366810 RepID=UPI00372D7384
MKKTIGHVTILVGDYDEAIAFYTGKAGFTLLADNAFGDGMRWVSLAPSAASEAAIVLVKADTEEKRARIGNQFADHVGIVVQTDDFRRDYEAMKAAGVKFMSEPMEVPWGIEAVFEDLYGNRFDLLQHNGF